MQILFMCAVFKMESKVKNFLKACPKDSHFFFNYFPRKTVKVFKIPKEINEFLKKKIVRYHFGWRCKKMMFICKSRFETQPPDL